MVAMNETAREAARDGLMAAMKSKDPEQYLTAMESMAEAVAKDVGEQYKSMAMETRADRDAAVLAQRGIRQLTSREKDYYQKLIEAMQAPDPKQAIENIDVVMPETVIDAVFDELQTAHPLLAHIQFSQTGGNVSVLMNTNDMGQAAWGPLCSEIAKEALAGFREVNMGLLKLSAFLPVCKASLEMGPEWLDSFVRQTLYEYIANGLEYGIVKGDGNNTPIGMVRDVSDGVAVVSGAYPAKAKIEVDNLNPETVGNLLSLIAVDGAGKPRTIRDIVLIVNPQDYYQKVMPATTIRSADGTYRNDVLPYPMTIIQSAALDVGEAVLGMGYKYFAGAGMDRAGRIEYSDQYQFLEDNRVYLIKLYANGFPMDNNAFQYLDITGLKPAILKVETVDATAASTDATLADLKIGALTLNPAFAGDTTAYTVSTSNATNTVTATPNNAGATVTITNKDTDGTGTNNYSNGEAVTWFDGSNTLTVTVTAADGTTTKAYTVTVTKS